MIPKRIFYIWLGGKKNTLANICIENWRMMLPDYEVVEINEKTPEWFDFDYEYENNLWFKTVYDLKMWAYAADYMRIKTLYEHGGIYFDTDVTVYKDLTPLLSNKMFAGNCLNNLAELAIFGTEKKHPILEKMINFYNDGIWKSKDYIISRIFTNILNNEYNLILNPNQIIGNDIVNIYPAEYFHPFHYDRQFTHDCITENTYTVHWMNASWHSKLTFYFLSNKHRIPLNTLLKQLEFINQVEKNSKTHITKGCKNDKD